MAPVIETAIVVDPLTRTTRDGEVLRRPARIQAEIAEALELSLGEILVRAKSDPAADEAEFEEGMSEECMVHLIRRDLRARASGKAPPNGRLAEDLMPLLLERCDRGLKGAIRGFPPSAASEVREEVLGRLAVSLAGAGNEADFLEVRFALALKRLRIDVCRSERRRLQGLVALEDVTAGTAVDDAEAVTLDLASPAPPNQEDRLLIRQALTALTAEERKVLVLHKFAGVPLNSNVATGATLVGLLGRSERTLRNRLRSAEAKLVKLQVEGRQAGRTQADYSREDRR